MRIILNLITLPHNRSTVEVLARPGSSLLLCFMFLMKHKINSDLQLLVFVKIRSLLKHFVLFHLYHLRVVYLAAIATVVVVVIFAVTCL